LIQQPVRDSRIAGQTIRQPAVARGPRLAILTLDEQSRGDTRLAPVWVHQAIQFVAEIQRFHSTAELYASPGARATSESKLEQLIPDSEVVTADNANGWQLEKRDAG